MLKVSNLFSFINDVSIYNQLYKFSYYFFFYFLIHKNCKIYVKLIHVNKIIREYNNVEQTYLINL